MTKKSPYGCGDCDVFCNSTKIAVPEHLRRLLQTLDAAIELEILDSLPQRVSFLEHHRLSYFRLTDRINKPLTSFATTFSEDPSDGNAKLHLLADAEPTKHSIQNVVGVDRTGHLAQALRRRTQFRRNKLVSLL